VPLRAIQAEADDQKWRGEQSGAADACVAAQEVEGKLNASAAVIPAAAQLVEIKPRDGEEARLARGMGNEILEVDAEIKVEAIRAAISLKRLEDLQGTI
jgi:hypothetical protein